MNIFKWTSHSREETIAFALKLSRHLKAGDILCLHGELGAGKTTFVKGIAQGLKFDQNEVSSPTFVLMNCYEAKLPIYHFDLYRLEGEDQISLIGYDEFLYGKGIAIIEWPDRLGTLMPKDYLEVQIEHLSDTSRAFKLKGFGERFRILLQKFSV